MNKEWPIECWRIWLIEQNELERRRHLEAIEFNCMLHDLYLDRAKLFYAMTDRADVESVLYPRYMAE